MAAATADQAGQGANCEQPMGAQAAQLHAPKLQPNLAVLPPFCCCRPARHSLWELERSPGIWDTSRACRPARP
jgi:hypothetical protein